MMAWIEENPYKWHDPIARDLHQRLVNTFYEPDPSLTASLAL